MITLKIILIVLAGFFKAVCEVISNHGDNSKFFYMSPWWWQKDYGKIIRFTGFRWNAWHISNSLMIACFTVIPCIDLPYLWLIRGAVFIGASIVFIIVFNLFYKKVLR